MTTITYRNEIHPETGELRRKKRVIISGIQETMDGKFYDLGTKAYRAEWGE